jgi:hypothetical protein
MMAAMAALLTLASCGTHKKVVKEQPKTEAEIQDSLNQSEFLGKVHSTASRSQFVSSKVKFTVEAGPQSLTLTGNLRMKRDDVIRLQLMAFGFVEAGRLEFTKDYVLIMDRINKQYLKAPYQYIDFLRNSGINFYTLQALFWDELFVPGQGSVSEDKLEKFNANMGGDEVVISLDQQEGKINYSWLADQQTGRIKMTNIIYRDPINGNSQLNWDYREFGPLGNKLFPIEMLATLTTPKKEVKLGVKLTYLGNDSEWEPRTVVSDKYRQVDIDEILMRLMAL